LKGNSDRLVKLEVRYRKLKQQKQEADNKLKRSAKLLRQLESVQRRRETLLRNIVRRYREVSEQYRAVALQVNNPDQFSSGGVDLSRLQNAVTLAEEDLRQLRPLNARAQCLQKELCK
jgi:chromosome segregation ATPase